MTVNGNEIIKEPAQPGEDAWSFVRELQMPLHQRVDLVRKRRRTGEADLSRGVDLVWEFPDPDGLLETAYADFNRFIELGGIGIDGPYRLVTVLDRGRERESYRLEVDRRECRLLAGDTEGVRRGLVHLEDVLQGAGGPFLRMGIIERKPVIRTRISRCFFGPINRPPKNRDELTDDIDYYPDEYLNRLAHDGINGLWLTIRFSDLCPSRFFPEAGKDAERRLAKLREIVRKCASYGVKIYVFCIEPRGFGSNPEYLNGMDVLKRNPQLAGHREGDLVYFCTSSAEGQEYLQESTRHVFTQVPGLGGLIAIHMGERPTSCYSHMPWQSGNNCPRCSRRNPGDVYRDMLSAMRRGMSQGNPDAELISWLYVPYLLDLPGMTLEQREDGIVDIAKRFPRDVVLQYNFESMGLSRQLGRDRVVRDYSLAYVGPGAVFRKIADAVAQAGARLSAKIQVGCSHEVATVPCVPVPGNLYRKYREMHRLGASAVMECWFFGSYPSIMTKAAGELAFSPFPRTETAFLRQLASMVWGERHAKRVAQAWACFGRAYRAFPANLNFAWYGPVHDCVTWPLHLIPVDKPIAPSWLLGHPISGDRIGECMGMGHSLSEILLLCGRMDREWKKGMRILAGVGNARPGRQDMERDVVSARALGVQINSAFNVIRFYALRESLIFGPSNRRRGVLASLRRIVVAEAKNADALAGCAETASNLGFHSEAEGYKYFPDKLRWRAGQLRRLLEVDFPVVGRMIAERGVLFPGYSCPRPGVDEIYDCPRLAIRRESDWNACPIVHCRAFPAAAEQDRETTWQAAHDDSRLRMRIFCRMPAGVARQKKANFQSDDHVVVSIEPRRLWPARVFRIGLFGQTYSDDGGLPSGARWVAKTKCGRDSWSIDLDIPFACLGEPSFADRPRRINVTRVIPGVGEMAWRQRHPVPYRLIFGDENPDDYAWICFGGNEKDNEL